MEPCGVAAQCSDAFCWTLLQELDHGPAALPQGARVTLLNEHSWPEDFGKFVSCALWCLRGCRLRCACNGPSGEVAWELPAS